MALDQNKNSEILEGVKMGVEAGATGVQNQAYEDIETRVFEQGGPEPMSRVRRVAHQVLETATAFPLAVQDARKSRK